MKSNRILEYLLYLFVFLLPLQTRWIIFDPQINGQSWEYGRISLYAFDVVFITLLLSLSAFAPDSLFSRKKKFLNSNQTIVDKPQQATADRLLYFALPLVVFCFLSIIWTDNKLLSFYWSLRILQGVLLVWLINKINFSKIKLAWAFVMGVALSAILGFYQFLTQSAFASKWLGLAYHSATVLGDSVVESADGRWLRAYGSFPHPNVLAGFCVAAILVCWWLLSQKHPPAPIVIGTSRAGKNTKNTKTQKHGEQIIFDILLITNYSLLITALFFTFSRAAWLAFLLVTGYWLLVTFKKNKKIFLYSFTPLFLLILLVAIYFPLLQTRLQGVERLELKSNIERVSGYQESWQIIKNNPWLGVGVGNYTNELQKINPEAPAWVYQPAHIVYLLVLAELGIIGVLFITLLLYYFITFSNQQPTTNNQQPLFLYYFIFIFLFLFFFDHYFWTLPSGMLLIWLILGLGLTRFSQGVR